MWTSHFTLVLNNKHNAHEKDCKSFWKTFSLFSYDSITEVRYWCRERRYQVQFISRGSVKLRPTFSNMALWDRFVHRIIVMLEKVPVKGICNLLYVRHTKTSYLIVLCFQLHRKEPYKVGMPRCPNGQHKQHNQASVWRSSPLSQKCLHLLTALLICIAQIKFYFLL